MHAGFNLHCMLFKLMFMSKQNAGIVIDHNPHPKHFHSNSLCPELLLDNVLERDGIGSELADTLAELLNGHLVLVEVEAEVSLVRDVRLLLNVEGACRAGLELLGNSLLGVLELLQQAGGDGQVIATSKLSDLANVAERSAHNNGVVAELLVVVVDALDGGNTGVLLLGVVLLGVSLEPVEDTADEGRNEEGTGLGGGNGLHQAEHERQVAVDAVVALQDLGGLDTLPRGGDLNQDTLLGDALLLVELYMQDMTVSLGFCLIVSRILYKTARDIPR